MGEYTEKFADTKNMPQYDLARKRATQQVGTAKQETSDAMQRRFANLGNLNSGSQLKQEQVLHENSNKALNEAHEGINAQQQAEILRREEVLQGQEFHKGEREAGQKYGTGEREAGQQFHTGERQAGQEFARGERLGGENFQATENAVQRGIQNRQFNDTKALEYNKFNAQNAQFERQQSLEERSTNFNMEMAQAELNEKNKSWMDKTFGSSKPSGGGENSTRNETAKYAAYGTAILPGMGTLAGASIPTIKRWFGWK